MPPHSQPRGWELTRLRRDGAPPSEQELQDGTARAEDQLLADGAGSQAQGEAPAAQIENEAAAAMREATAHLEMARAALKRQRAAMAAASAALAVERDRGARLGASLNTMADGEGDALAAMLSAKRDGLAAAVRELAATQPAAGAGAEDLLGQAQRAARDEAEVALELLKAQEELVQTAAEAQRGGMAGEEGHLRVVAEGREMVAAGARDVAEALRAQAELLLLAQRAGDADVGDEERTAEDVADSLQTSIPLLGPPSAPTARPRRDDFAFFPLSFRFLPLCRSTSVPPASLQLSSALLRGSACRRPHNTPVAPT